MAERHPELVEAVIVPAATAWPLIGALGATLTFAGLVTHVTVTVVGVVLFFAAAVGWFRSVLPQEETEIVPLRPVAQRARPIVAAPHKVEHLQPGGVHDHRMRLPVEIHPYSAGLWAGLAGGVAMAVIACAFGLLAFGSVWYPINLLAAAALPSLANASVEELSSFHGVAFFIATLVHGAMSLLTGFLYAFLLPTMPRRPILMGGIVAPLLWTGLIWASLGIINPVLDARIHWGWFVASQVVFGLVAGFVVARSERIRTMQALPLAMRAGIEGGMREDEMDEEKPR
jgi:hypothetical protein